MITINITEDHDVILIQNDNGLATLEFTDGHQAVSNLVRARIRTMINWRLFLENDIDEALLAQQLRTIIDSTDGVRSSDFTNFSSSLNQKNRAASFTGVCFTVDCNNSHDEVFFL